MTSDVYQSVGRSWHNDFDVGLHRFLDIEIGLWAGMFHRHLSHLLYIQRSMFAQISDLYFIKDL
jgi:hypothetical protein